MIHPYSTLINDPDTLAKFGFSLQKNEYGYLIKPMREKEKWLPQELDWRNSIVDDNGVEISGSLPTYRWQAKGM